MYIIFYTSAPVCVRHIFFWHATIKNDAAFADAVAGQKTCLDFHAFHQNIKSRSVYAFCERASRRILLINTTKYLCLFMAWPRRWLVTFLFMLTLSAPNVNCGASSALCWLFARPTRQCVLNAATVAAACLCIFRRTLRSHCNLIKSQETALISTRIA